MSLPPSFETPEDYFVSCISFFRRYQHLYSTANTEILVNNILDKILVKNLEDLDVFRPDFDLISRVDDEFLKDFFGELARFEATHGFEENKVQNVEVDVHLSPKKRHEIVHLAEEIVEACKDSRCDTVVDFGSGLGYLDQLIHQISDLNVLGLECNESHYVGAKTRQRKYHPDSTERVKYIRHFISEGSHNNIKQFLDDKFTKHSGFCITGLHSCADLTVDAINLFSKMADARSMVLMPCCYHKMKLNQDGESLRSCKPFTNFPLSKSLRKVFDEYGCVEYLRVPFLRLAAQGIQWNLSGGSLEDLVFNLLSRAVLQLYAHRNNCKIKRNRRKAVKMKTLDKSFTSYLAGATSGFTLVREGKDPAEPVNYNSEELHAIWREVSEVVAFKKAAIYILMQNYLQPVVENFVLFDRLVYLKENGVVKCRFKKILNENISPRCWCLLAFK